MLPNDFIAFLREVQRIPVQDLAEVKQIQKEVFAGAPWLSYPEFADFLMSRRNSLDRGRSYPIAQDMSRPLIEYFISTSHNTYLTGDQLRSKSSAECYTRVLLEGCRCVEIDVWDGAEGEPYVLHGHTLTPHILARDALQAIAASAFTTSPYPVIISVENHLSIPQQERFAQLISSIFKTYLEGVPKVSDVRRRGEREREREK